MCIPGNGENMRKASAPKSVLSPRSRSALVMGKNCPPSGEDVENLSCKCRKMLSGWWLTYPSEK